MKTPIMPVIEIKQGKLIGTLSEDIDGKSFYSFRGVPYAKPPLGKLRFKAPLPPSPWQGIFQATRNGNCCYAMDMFKKKALGAEDCLNLNVYTPTLPSTNKELLPVMVWIHGGGFMSGSNSSEMYGPEFLMTANVVVVTINYRLGLLGFLSLDDPSAGAPGNAGFKDMVMALKWVKANINKFNGNFNNVTIFGESAGAAAVHCLMLSPMAQGLFHKAIAQSGCALNPFSRGKKCDKDLYRIFGSEGKKDSELLEYLQNLSVEALLEVQAKIEYVVDPNQLQPYGLVIERKCEEQEEPAFMTEEPIDIILSRKFADVPFIIGHTKLEGLFVTTYKPKRVMNMKTNFESNVPHFLGYKIGSKESKIVGQKIKEFYYGQEEPNHNNRHQFYEMVGDHTFVYGIYATVKKQCVNSHSPTYIYRMSLKSSLQFLQPTMQIDKDKGGAHGDDVAYLFKNVFTPQLWPDSLEYISIKRMVKLWTNFAHYGNPTPFDSSVIWEKVTEKQIGFLDIDKELTFHHTLDYRSMHFWDKLFAGSPRGRLFSSIYCKI